MIAELYYDQFVVYNMAFYLPLIKICQFLQFCTFNRLHRE